MFSNSGLCRKVSPCSAQMLPGRFSYCGLCEVSGREGSLGSVNGLAGRFSYSELCEESHLEEFPGLCEETPR
jgi:hypothetical protein